METASASANMLTANAAGASSLMVDREKSYMDNAPFLSRQFNLATADGDRFFPLRSHDLQDFNEIMDKKIEIESCPPLNLFDESNSEPGISAPNP